MKTTIPTSLFTAGILFLGLSTNCLAVDIPEKVDINLQQSNALVSTTSKDSKTVPAFSHAKHASIIIKNNSTHVSRPFAGQFTCTVCHPGVDSAEEIPTATAKQKQAEAVNGAGGVKEYMHGLCLDCHKSMKKVALATGPTTCKGCHNPE